MRLSACIEWLFAEGGRPFPDRIRAAADAGLERIEFWNLGDRNVDAIKSALRETGVRVTGFVSEPAARLVDPATHDEFVAGVRRSAEMASRLGAHGLIVVSGNTRPGVSRTEQRHAIASALGRAAPVAAEHGVCLLLEPLNSLIDHEGYFLDSTPAALGIVRDVGHPSVRLLYDLYHSTVMGEDPAMVLTGAGDLVGHVHLADVPGRHEPGTGGIDWPRQLAALRAAGYTGALGLEYMPLGETTSSLAFIRRQV